MRRVRAPLAAAVQPAPRVCLPTDPPTPPPPSTPGIDGRLAALSLAYVTNLFGGLTHYASAQARGLPPCLLAGL